VTVPISGLRRSGRVVYGERAFEQDAHEAMRGDIVRGLIELITNVDDAFARMGDVTGKVLVEVEHRRGSEWNVVVKDRATGMSQAEMVSRLVELGGRASGFESGAAVRGNLGRGAKDLPAFGPVLYESIKDGEYAALRLLSNGDFEALPRGRGVTAADRERLGVLRGNGTMVTVTVRPNIRCPNHSSLKRRLSQHFQLRDIMADPRREVILVNANDGARDRLRYEVAESEPLRSCALRIPEYPNAEAFLEVSRLPERCEEAQSDPLRPSGILIKGRRAIYENTLFSFEGNPHAAFLQGRLVCEYIDTLAREYDDRRSLGESQVAGNPIPIIARTRDSLRREHPFYVALSRAAEAVLGEIVREEEDRARREAVRVENNRTRRDLDRLARESARFIEEELRNAEADELPGTGPGRGAPPALSLIPSEAVCYLGESRTITLVAHAEGLTADASASVTLDPEGVVELVDGPTLPLVPHRRREDLLVAQIRVRPLLSEVTLLQCEVQGRTAEAMLEVKEERPIVEPLPIPATLEFERPRYRVGWNRTRTMILRAPRDLCEAGSVVQVSSSSSGLVVLTARVSMEFDMSLGYVIGRVRVEGRALGAEGTIRAQFGAAIAECRAVVTRDEEGPSLTFKIEDKDGGKYRALWEEQEDPATGERSRTLVIQARHPALRRYLGTAPDFPGQNGSLTRAVLAEIIADNVCREIARRVDALRTPEERPDSEGFYAEHYARMLKLLPRLHTIQVPVVPGEQLEEMSDLAPAEVVAS
jgi:hypothetical protein